ncbi:MAG: serine/threonine protein kinase [Thermoguttaceae bacterium]
MAITFDEHPTQTWGSHRAPQSSAELLEQYRAILEKRTFGWIAKHQLIERLGAGSQGVVYLTWRQGADHFCFPVALKIFSPERYPDSQSYEEATVYMGRIAAYVAQIQQDNLLFVQNWVEQAGIRVMVMEWVEGYDLRDLLTQSTFNRLHSEVGQQRWQYLNKVVVTTGPAQPRLTAGIALAVIRDCLAALSALHQAGIVHGDLKPANIMLKRTGNAKIIDIGSAFLIDDPPPRRTWTPAYAAPEVHRGENASPRSDLVSLGYALVEFLAGRSPFADLTNQTELMDAKQALPQRLAEFLPSELSGNDMLMSFCQQLIAPKVEDRFASAEDADLADCGAANIQRQLVKMDLASEYHNEIRLWLRDLSQDMNGRSF